MHGMHGRVGGNLFLCAYLLAVLGPAVKLFVGGTDSSRFVAPAVVVGVAALTVYAIRANGGGGVGEILGLMAGLLSWAGWLIAWLFAAEDTTGARKLVGASALPGVLALALLLRGRLGGRGGGR
jgi:hypothetical protein